MHTLDLSHNALGDQAALQLASVLCVNTTLTALNLSYNHITNRGLVYLRQAVGKRPHLRILHIGGNLECTPRTVRSFLDTSLPHLLYEGTFTLEVDPDLTQRWPLTCTWSDLVSRPVLPRPGSFTWITDPQWRDTCEVAYRVCEEYKHWPFFQQIAPPRQTYLDWTRSDPDYSAWHGVHETLSLALVHHKVDSNQYEVLLSMLQRVARLGREGALRAGALHRDGETGS